MQYAYIIMHTYNYNIDGAAAIVTNSEWHEAAKAVSLFCRYAYCTGTPVIFRKSRAAA